MKEGDVKMSNENEIIKAERPGGFLDFLPVDFLAREKMLRTIEKVFRSFGFDPIETPVIEFEKTLKGETGETGKQVFMVSDSNTKGESLGLRFDHTVPFARLLAANPYNARGKIGLRLPLRRMVVGPVFRGEKPQNGRYRQFYQFDADIAGTSSMMADAEIVVMMYRTLIALGVSNFTIRINNRKILNGLAVIADIKDRGSINADDITKKMMQILDKIDKIGIDNVVKELKQEPESEFDLAPALNDEAIQKIKQYLEIKGNNTEKLQKCKDIFAGNKIAEEGIQELEQIMIFLTALDIPESAVAIDFSIARGLDYYTGPVMETILNDAPKFGSIFSGGRYNGLVSRFTGKELSAVGASIGVDRMFAALDSLDFIDKENKTVTDVMILRLSTDKDSEYLKMARDVRKCGLNAEVCLLSDTTFKQQFNFALNRGVSYIVICGGDEFEKGTVQIKNLDTREQKEVPLEQIGGYFNK